MKKFNLFDYLTQTKRHDHERKIRYAEIGKGDYVYSPPENPYVIFEIISGVVKIGSYSKTGEEVTYDILIAGDTFGNLHYLNGQFNEFVKALTTLNLRVYDLDFFRHIITTDATLAEWFHRATVSRWCKMETRLFSIITNDALSRIEALQHELNLTITDNCGKKHHVFELLSQKDIANLTGTTRQTVAAVLRKKSE